MVVKIGAGKYTDHQKKLVANLLPDFCTIKPLVAYESPSGSWEEREGDPLLYKGSQLIPCRVDPTSHHREEDVFIQEKIVNEYSIWLPYDAPLTSNQHVYFKTKVYDVRKISEQHSWGILKSALITEVQ